MRYDPNAHWSDKLARIERMVAARLRRLSPSPAVVAETAVITARARASIHQLLDEPLRHTPGETQRERLLARTVTPTWWERKVSRNGNGSGAAK